MSARSVYVDGAVPGFRFDPNPDAAQDNYSMVYAAASKSAVFSPTPIVGETGANLTTTFSQTAGTADVFEDVAITQTIQAIQGGGKLKTLQLTGKASSNNPAATAATITAALPVEYQPIPAGRMHTTCVIDATPCDVLITNTDITITPSAALVAAQMTLSTLSITYVELP